MASDAIALGPVVQGVVIALAIIAIAVIYFDRLSSISKDISSVAESTSSIEDEITSVELPDMERTLVKLDYALEQRGASSDLPTGEGTIYHKLPENDIEVGISYVTTHPESHGHYFDVETGEIDESYDGPEAVLEFEFGEEINMQGIFDRLNANDELGQVESEVFEREVGVRPISPFEVRVHFPTNDYEKISEFLPRYLEAIDSTLSEIREEKNEIESLFKENLDQI